MDCQKERFLMVLEHERSIRSENFMHNLATLQQWEREDENFQMYNAYRSSKVYNYLST